MIDPTTVPEQFFAELMHTALAADNVEDSALVLQSAFAAREADLVGAVSAFLADYDDGDRADAGCSALMELHVRDLRAALQSREARHG